VAAYGELFMATVTKLKGKSYDIPKRLLWDAWLKV